MGQSELSVMQLCDSDSTSVIHTNNKHLTYIVNVLTEPTEFESK